MSVEGVNSVEVSVLNLATTAVSTFYGLFVASYFFILLLVKWAKSEWASSLFAVVDRSVLVWGFCRCESRYTL